MNENDIDHLLSFEAIQRKLQYMTVTRVARESGVSEGTLTRIKCGHAESIRSDTARKLTEFFNRM